MQAHSTHAWVPVKAPACRPACWVTSYWKQLILPTSSNHLSSRLQQLYQFIKCTSLKGTCREGDSNCVNSKISVVIDPNESSRALYPSGPYTASQKRQSNKYSLLSKHTQEGRLRMDALPWEVTRHLLLERIGKKNEDHCSGLNCSSQKRDVYILTSRTRECGLIWERGLCRCNQADVIRP